MRVRSELSKTLLGQSGGPLVSNRVLKLHLSVSLYKRALGLTCCSSKQVRSPAWRTLKNNSVTQWTTKAQPLRFRAVWTPNPEKSWPSFFSELGLFRQNKTTRTKSCFLVFCETFENSTPEPNSLTGANQYRWQCQPRKGCSPRLGRRTRNSRIGACAITSWRKNDYF